MAPFDCLAGPQSMCPSVESPLNIFVLFWLYILHQSNPKDEERNEHVEKYST